tara:strand:+ start:518 stop:745 length:228 start_codon:yes stop_codon:yes gene_type:complete
MAKNTGNSCRKGAVKERSQVYNDKTKQYVKRNKKNGRFLSSKKTAYKGVKKESEKNTDEKKTIKKVKKKGKKSNS